MKGSGSDRFFAVLSLAREARKSLEESEPSMEKISHWKVVVASVNNFPTAAGLASSASGYACLAYSLAELFELTLSTSEISRIARMGSGSACRSLFGGYVKWEMGNLADGSDSMAIQVASESDWPDMEALILVVSDAKKDVGSTEGMQETVQTSELLKHRISSVVPERMNLIEKAIKEKDFDSFAEITMADSNQFHAVCLDTYPPIFYLNDISRGIIRLITAFNKLFLDGNSKGYKVAYTFDAGPNAVLYMPRKNVALVLGLIDHFFPSLIAREQSPISRSYYGRSMSYFSQINQQELDAVIAKIPFAPWPAECLKRIISTTVGDGPRLLSTNSSDDQSLLNDSNTPK